jgi:hypothetical protein
MISLAELGAEPNTRTLIILTGPPGSRPEEWVKEQGLPFYGKHNRAMWRDHPTREPIVMITPAPDASAKEYWVKEAHRFGWKPILLVTDPGEYRAITNLWADMGATKEDLKKRLAKTVKRWYASYTQHSAEVYIDG